MARAVRMFLAPLLVAGLACGGAGGDAEVVAPLLPFQHGKVGIYAASGYVDTTGQVRLPADYRYAGRHSEGLAWVRGVDGGYGLLDETGGWVVEPTLAYDYTEPFQGGVARVKDAEGRWGLVDAKGAEIASPKWEGIAPASDGLSAAFGPDGCVYLTATGEARGAFERCMPFADGLAAVATADGWSYVDTSLETAIPGPFDTAGDFAEGRAWVQRDVKTAPDREPYGGWQLIDAKGTVLRATDDTIEQAWPFSGGVSLVSTGAGHRFVGPDGAWGSVFEGARSDSDGLALVSVTGGAGYADASGRIVLAGPYEPPKDWAAATDPRDFAGGAALARPAGEAAWGVLGSDGAWRVPPEFVEVEPFVDGWARVKTARGWVWVAADGTRVVPPGG